MPTCWVVAWTSRSSRCENGRGEFYNQELHAGQAVYARFVWSSITPTSCRWEQALSADGGRSWETNWIMEMTRWER
jgi:hypothetical protein